MWCLQIFYDAKVVSCIVHVSKGMTGGKKKEQKKELHIPAFRQESESLEIVFLATRFLFKILS